MRARGSSTEAGMRLGYDTGASMADFTPKNGSENEPGTRGYGEPKDHTPNARAPSGGKAKGASAEHQAPPVLHLEAHHIEKLFKNKMPPIGSKIKVHGLVHVGAYSEGADGPPSGGKAKGGEGNTGRTMALHFHKMDVAQDNQGG